MVFFSRVVWGGFLARSLALFVCLSLTPARTGSGDEGGLWSWATPRDKIGVIAALCHDLVVVVFFTSYVGKMGRKMSTKTLPEASAAPILHPHSGQRTPRREISAQCKEQLTGQANVPLTVSASHGRVGAPSSGGVFPSFVVCLPFSSSRCLVPSLLPPPSPRFSFATFLALVLMPARPTTNRDVTGPYFASAAARVVMVMPARPPASRQRQPPQDLPAAVAPGVCKGRRGSLLCLLRRTWNFQ